MRADTTIKKPTLVAVAAQESESWRELINHQPSIDVDVAFCPGSPELPTIVIDVIYLKKGLGRFTATLALCSELFEYGLSVRCVFSTPIGFLLLVVVVVLLK
jgi:hypothetical protein